MTADEAAKYLNISKHWVYDHVRRSTPRIPVIRLGGSLRFDPLDLDKFVNDQADASRRKKN